MTELLQCKLNIVCQKVIGIMFVFYFITATNVNHNNDVLVYGKLSTIVYTH